MIDPSKDPRKSGAPIILPSIKSLTDAEASKDAKYSNGDLTQNQKKKIHRKAKWAAQRCAGKEAAEEVEQEATSAEDSCHDEKSNMDSSGEEANSSAAKDKPPLAVGTKDGHQGRKRGSLGPDDGASQDDSA
ncbi:hypothetical protein ACH5RR_009782 [Cinchona calisaya]|uniref:Uncharacterized protein n=1 Tax=Cinchona calisaya TaxID=153742 RepID=A0ABD3AI36_9GENT